MRQDPVRNALDMDTAISSVTVTENGQTFLRKYLMCKCWNFSNPDLFVTSRERRIGFDDEVMKETHVLKQECRACRLKCERY
jgi:hypothetical protein